MRVDFILSKDPASEHGGDVAMTRLVMSLARASFSVRGLALSRETQVFGDDIRRTPKPPLNGVDLLLKGIRTQRSLIHCRFNTPGLAKMIAESDADCFVAEHSYMAEPYLAVRADDSRNSLLVNTHVSEADVWKQTRSKVWHFERRKLERDEARVAKCARSVAYFDRDEADQSPAAKPYWLNLTLPPKIASDRSATAPFLVFLGDRTWPPNAEAARRTLRLWPRIASGISDARLVFVGKPENMAETVDLPAGVQDLKFVDNLDALLSDARALIAPVSAGGGVRVKILEAASIGLPVVGTRAALGSLGDVLPLKEYNEDNSLIQAARSYLMDANQAGIDGRDLFETNASRWALEAPHKDVQDWLVGK